jgi:hypothetical protein
VIAPAPSIPNIGRYLATRPDLSLKKGPDSETIRQGKVRFGVFAQLDYFLIANHSQKNQVWVCSPVFVTP